MSDELFDEFMIRKEKKCIVSRAIEQLNDVDREKILAACARPDILTNSILDWYRTRGTVSFSRDSLRIHRLGECSCGR